MAEAESKERLNKREVIVLCFILLLGLILRTYKLGDNSIWLDEGLSITIAIQNSIKNFYLYLFWNGQQPLYHIILSAWINLFGKSEVACRFPSVIFGVINVFYAYKLGALLFSKKTGLIGALLTCLSTFQINFSTEARPYILMSLLSTLSIYFFIKILKEEKLKNFACYILFSTLLIYNHTAGILTIFTENTCVLFLLIYKKSGYITKIKSWIFSQLLIFIFLSPWLSSLIKELIYSPSRLSWIQEPNILEIYKTFVIYFSGNGILSIIFLLLICTAYILSRKRMEVLLTNIFLLIPILSLFFMSKAFFPIYNQSYTVISSIPFYILISTGLDHYNKHIKSLLLIGIALLQFWCIKDFYVNAFPCRHKTVQWREAIRYIDKSALRNDLLIFYPSYIEVSFDYYSKRNDLTKIMFENIIDEEKLKEFKKKISNCNKFWVISQEIAPMEKILKKEDYNVIVNENFKYIRIENYTKK